MIIMISSGQKTYLREIYSLRALIQSYIDEPVRTNAAGISWSNKPLIQLLEHCPDVEIETVFGHSDEGIFYTRTDGIKYQVPTSLWIIVLEENQTVLKGLI